MGTWNCWKTFSSVLSYEADAICFESKNATAQVITNKKEKKNQNYYKK